MCRYDGGAPQGFPVETVWYTVCERVLELMAAGESHMLPRHSQATTVPLLAADPARAEFRNAFGNGHEPAVRGARGVRGAASAW
jgi:hypothetical protein